MTYYIDSKPTATIEWEWVLHNLLSIKTKLAAAHEMANELNQVFELVFIRCFDALEPRARLSPEIFLQRYEEDVSRNTRVGRNQ